MFNILFELETLKASLINRGFDTETAESIVNKAKNEINSAISDQMNSAMDLAIETGVQKRSSDFINELKMDVVNFQLTTETGNFDFSEPPYPMLSHLLRNAKPMKDGSGVYKVIPVGSKTTNLKPVQKSIYDAHKQINVERIENSKNQYEKIVPKASKTTFKTATSKQDPSTQWVMPAKDKDFTQEMFTINHELRQSTDDIVKSIIRSYEEGF